MSIKGKNAVITGSTSGIGLGIARSLASAGCNIMLNGFGAKAAINSLLSEFPKIYGVKVIYSDADISKPTEIRQMVDTCTKTFGGVDILVNNAGIQFVSPIESFPEDKWDSIISINLSAAFHSIKAVIPSMKANNFGRIINIASAHGLVASRNKSAYVAAKHGIVGLTKAVALETAESSITCNAICPGWVATPLVQKQIEANAKTGGISVEQATINLLSEKHPSKRFVQPEDIGAFVVFLCGKSTGNMTGEILSIDGGWTAQ